MIKSFNSKETERIFGRDYSKKFPQEIQRIVLRKLRMLNRAREIRDLKVPPGNRLEVLKGNRKEQHSIRINNKWRICFQWNGTDTLNVEIVDYH